MVSFYERTQPLAQLSKQLDKIQAETTEAFKQGQLSGWEDRGIGGPGDEAAEAAKQLSVDLETFDSVGELETMGEWEIGF